MAIGSTTREITIYYAMCDGCGLTGPEGTSKRDAIAWIKEQGWYHESKWNGLVHFDLILCPKCDQEAEK